MTRRSKVLRRLFGLVVALLLILGAWAFWLEPASLCTKTYQLEIPHWSTTLSGMRVAEIADLHVGSPFNGLDNLKKVVQRTNAAQPDLIVIAGDFVITGVPGGNFVDPESIATVLRNLSAPMGVYAVLGNHDWWFDRERVRQAVESAGIEVIDDRAVKLHYKVGGLWLAGISDYTEGPHDVQGTLASIDDKDPILLLTHNPDVFPEVPNTVSLTIAAHTHGGQVYIPFIGRPVVPSRYGMRYAIGHVVEGGRHLFVNPGIGTSVLPVRFLVRPEISILKLGPEHVRVVGSSTSDSK